MSKSGSKLLQKTKMNPIHKVADMETHEQFAGNIFDDTQKKAGLTMRRRRQSHTITKSWKTETARKTGDYTRERQVPSKKSKEVQTEGS